MSKTIYLIRHGQTLFNLHHKTQGRVDSPLTDLGIRQAQATRDYFKDNGISFDKAFCSTQERASDTLEIITNNQMTYERLKDLREKSYGIYEGQDEYTLPWNRGLSRNTDPSMEADDDVVKRMEKAIEYILTKMEDGESAIVVGHGDILAQYARQHNKRVQFKMFKNCAVAKMKAENGSVEMMNYVWPAVNIL
ncbi:putative phosphoglycerate mutase [Lactobacillus colini]|uniref:Phosphoglycerate mutase n=1 Tax=Lactobacillus colini TaxID=1819254 RepID=A0ABS4MGH4_9LACO|nr:histidine phosphatase family protein [Lactobacillus colini]MBP2058411.1 putative phosphoglycerate mutase [Lactobacillus colini]